MSDRRTKARRAFVAASVLAAVAALSAGLPELAALAAVLAIAGPQITAVLAAVWAAPPPADAVRIIDEAGGDHMPSVRKRARKPCAPTPPIELQVGDAEPGGQSVSRSYDQ
jgi:hypothetical protein